MTFQVTGRCSNQASHTSQGLFAVSSYGERGGGDLDFTGKGGSSQADEKECCLVNKPLLGPQKHRDTEGKLRNQLAGPSLSDPSREQAFLTEFL